MQDRERSTRTPFRFENMQLQAAEQTLMRKWLDDAVATMVGSPSSKPGKELKLPKKDIEVWNKEILGRVEVKMRQSMNEMRDSERAEEGKELEERERENREFDEGASLLALAQETSWRKT